MRAAQSAFTSRFPKHADQRQVQRRHGVPCPWRALPAGSRLARYSLTTPKAHDGQARGEADACPQDGAPKAAEYRSAADEPHDADRRAADHEPKHQDDRPPAGAPDARPENQPLTHPGEEYAESDRDGRGMNGAGGQEAQGHAQPQASEPERDGTQRPVDAQPTLDDREDGGLTDPPQAPAQAAAHKPAEGLAVEGCPHEPADRPPEARGQQPPSQSSLAPPASGRLGGSPDRAQLLSVDRSPT